MFLRAGGKKAMRRVLLTVAFFLLSPNAGHAIWCHGRWFDTVGEYREYERHHDPSTTRG